MPYFAPVRIAFFLLLAPMAPYRMGNGLCGNFLFLLTTRLNIAINVAQKRIYVNGARGCVRYCVIRILRHHRIFDGPETKTAAYKWEPFINGKAIQL